MPTLAQALIAASPRLTPVRTPLASWAIHAGVLTLWVLLFARAFSADGLAAWSAGLAYIAYDTALLGFTAWQTLRLLRPPPSPQAGPRVTLGVIVAAHNEAAGLPATLAALTAQSDPPDAILIADDGSTDGTASVLARLYELSEPALGTLGPASPVLPALRWLRLPHAGKARALNAALSRIETEAVLTVDADTLLDPDAIAAMRAAFAADPGLVAATGVLTPVCALTASGRLMQWFQTYEYIRNFLSRAAWHRLDSLLLISGAFAGFRRQAVLDVGGFDPACLVEDYELIHRLRRHGVLGGLGWRTRVLGRATARTDAPATPAAFLRQRRRWFGGFLQTQLWYRAMVGDPRYGWLGLAMLPVKAIDTLQPLYGLVGAGLLAVYLARGEGAVLAPVAGVIAAKIALDFAFHLWAVHLYRRWTGGRTSGSIPGAMLAAVVEPFSFQLLRHLGAALGWVTFLTGSRVWGGRGQLGVAADGSG